MKRYKHLPTYRYYDVKGLPLNLDKSAGKYLRDYKLHGNSIQNGTPTPDTPVEVKSVGDIGKNKFNIETITEGYYVYKANGKITKNEYFNISDYIEVHEDFTISWDSDSNYLQINLVYYDENKVHDDISRVKHLIATKQITVDLFKPIDYRELVTEHLRLGG